MKEYTSFFSQAWCADVSRDCDFIWLYDINLTHI